MLSILLIFATVLFYSLQRLVFLAWNWDVFKNQTTGDLIWAFIYGLRFDLSAIAILALIPFILSLVFYRWLKSTRGFLLGLFAVIQLPGIIFSLGDSEYVNFTGRRFTYDALFNFREIPGKFFQIIFGFWPLLIVSLALITFLLWVFYRLYKGVKWEPQFDKLSIGKKSAIFFLVFLSLLIGARGGLQKKPIGFAHAQIFPQPMMNNLVMNSAFTFLQTIKRKSLERYKFFDSAEEMLKHLNGNLPGPSLLEGHRPPGPQNVVVIILESFSFEHMGPDGYTPFLDSVALKGISFKNHFANGRRSIEGIGAILGGIPAMMAEPFLSSQYMSNYFLGVGTLLGKKGYHTSFFHGAANGTFYFDSFIQSLGIQNYFGSFEYPEPADNDGTWGIFDEPFFLWTKSKLDSFPQPFFSAVFSLTSHNPFRIPEKHAGKFPKGPSEIHEVIGYTDFALSRFFQEAEKQSWFKNTLFIITADHTSKAWRPGKDNELEQHHIPLILYHPSWQPPQIDLNLVTQQIDILPTILDFLNVEGHERNYLARSIFVPGERTATIFNDGRYHLIGRDYFLTYQPLTGEFSFNSRSGDPQPPELKEEAQLRLKASIQYFSQGLWDNKLYFPTTTRY